MKVVGGAAEATVDGATLITLSSPDSSVPETAIVTETDDEAAVDCCGSDAVPIVPTTLPSEMQTSVGAEDGSDTEDS